MRQIESRGVEPDRALLAAEPQAEPVLAVRDISVRYAQSGLALQGVSLSVFEGRVSAVIGPNGAGKTTLARSITGFLPNEKIRIISGDVRVRGRSVINRTPDAVARMGAALVPERDKIIKELTVEEHFSLLGASTEAAFEMFPMLLTHRRQEAGLLSGGQRQALALSLALARHPPLLVVDELTLGLSAAAITAIVDGLKKNLDGSMAVLIIEQNAAIALELADWVHVIESGVVVHEGTPQQIRDSGDLASFYLGNANEGSYAEIKQYRQARRWWLP